MNPFFIACVFLISYNENDEKQEIKSNFINRWLLFIGRRSLLRRRLCFSFLLL